MKKPKKRGLEFLKLEHPTFRVPKTFGQRASDWLTKLVGSWPFIIIFIIYIIIWIAFNIYAIMNHWDPYPFILLNLTLSILAAILLPILLMSQNIESQKDRARAQYDYAVNRKAEKEIQEIKKQLNRIERTMSRRKR